MSTFSKSQITPWSATKFALITPSDSADLAFIPRGIVVGTAGDVKMSDHSGTATVVPSLVAGIIHPLSPTRIWSTGTTAVGIVVVV